VRFAIAMPDDDDDARALAHEPRTPATIASDHSGKLIARQVAELRCASRQIRQNRRTLCDRRGSAIRPILIAAKCVLGFHLPAPRRVG
jgi:hypothetical protein